MSLIKKIFIAVSLVAISSVATARYVPFFSPKPQSIIGRVVGVSDGDTIKVLDADNKQHKIRLYGIDAPEKAQDFGQAAKKRLSQYIFDKHVSVDIKNTDRYGRIVGVVYFEGSIENSGFTKHNINLQMVLDGMAWAYVSYLRSADKAMYVDAQKDAENVRVGIWSINNPTPPWSFRRAKKGGRYAGR
jgi:endonuclease YncB( thermonuclease family)